MHRVSMRRTGACLVLTVLLVACESVGIGTIDPSAPRVVPAVGPDAALVQTTGAADAMTPGVEGSVLFVRLVAPGGGVVLDRPSAWPSDRERVPPGEYAMTVYFRGCNGNCGMLEGEDRFCIHDITLAPNDRLEVHVEPNQLEPGSICTLDEA